MLMAIYMKDSGKMIWQMEKGFTYTVEVPNMKVSGKMIYKMASELKYGRIMQDMKGSI